MRTPPSLLSLTIDSALLNFSHISDLSFLPDHILLDLFLRTLRAGKLNEKVLKLFVATGKDEILALIRALNIRQSLIPVLPTRRLHKYLQTSIFIKTVGRCLSQALRLRPWSDLTTFMNEWRPIFSHYHLIVVKDPDLTEELQIPDGFNINVYTKSDIDQMVGSTSIIFSGYSCRYFGFLVSRKKYIICVDVDCIPAKDEKGCIIDIVAQHLSNLTTPATPFFFNTLYDPYQKGADFVRGYPFSLRSGVTCALSCGLWLNLADYDAPTLALKEGQRYLRYVDAVLTIPSRALMSVSGINIAFNRELVGPALFPALRLGGEGKLRYETMEDIWCGMCAKVICDHLGLGVKSGLPYVWRTERGNAIDSLKKEWEGVKLMEEVVPFFQSLRLKPSAANAEDCVLEIAKQVKEKLGQSDSLFARAADAMVEWVKLWKAVGSS